MYNVGVNVEFQGPDLVVSGPLSVGLGDSILGSRGLRRAPWGKWGLPVKLPIPPGVPEVAEVFFLLPLQMWGSSRYVRSSERPKAGSLSSSDR